MGFQIINCLEDSGRYPLPSGGNPVAVNEYHITYMIHQFTVELVGYHFDDLSNSCFY